jgi:hypothetical protein
MSRQQAHEQAAICYRRAGYEMDAARCYALAGAHRRAAEIYAALRLFGQAAASFAEAGLPEVGAWLLAHVADQPDQARALLAASGQRAVAALRQESEVSGLCRRLVLARCEIAEGAAPEVIRSVIAEVCAALADPSTPSDQVAEEWAVALSEAAQRYDQAALVFAAAVRGGRYGAGQRWKAWAREVLRAEIVIPPPVAREVPAPAATTSTSVA